MRAQITIVLDVEDEDSLMEAKTVIENSLYGIVNYDTCDAEICPEDGEDDGDYEF